MELLAAALLMATIGTLAYGTGIIAPTAAAAATKPGPAPRLREPARITLRIVGGVLIGCAAIISAALLASGTLS